MAGSRPEVKRVIRALQHHERVLSRAEPDAREVSRARAELEDALDRYGAWTVQMGEPVELSICDPGSLSVAQARQSGLVYAVTERFLLHGVPRPDTDAESADVLDADCDLVDLINEAQMRAVEYLNERGIAVSQMGGHLGPSRLDK